MKGITVYKKIMFVGAVLVVVFNPLSVALWSDVLVSALNWLSVQLITVSHYSVIIGITLLVVSGLMFWDGRSKKNSAKLKKLKNKKTQSAGAFID